MVNTIPSEAKGESVSANSLYGMVLETPSPSVQVTVNLEDQDETVKHTKPEDAAKYVQAFEMGSGQDIHPSGLPDPEEFATENVSYSAQADDTLGYTITITGRSDIEGGSVAKDDQEMNTSSAKMVILHIWKALKSRWNQKYLQKE